MNRSSFVSRTLCSEKRLERDCRHSNHSFEAIDHTLLHGVLKFSCRSHPAVLKLMRASQALRLRISSLSLSLSVLCVRRSPLSEFGNPFRLPASSVVDLAQSS